MIAGDISSAVHLGDLDSSKGINTKSELPRNHDSETGK